MIQGIASDILKALCCCGFPLYYLFGKRLIIELLDWGAKYNKNWPMKGIGVKDKEG
jgi:hypothetical protein